MMKHALALINENPRDYRNLRGKKARRGIGAYTLCERCNNQTGAWYGAAYAHFARQGMEYLTPQEKPTLLYYPFRIYPLHVIKQVMCMFI